MYLRKLLARASRHFGRYLFVLKNRVVNVSHDGKCVPSLDVRCLMH